MLATIDRLLVEASPASTRTLNRGRILKREPANEEAKSMTGQVLQADNAANQSGHAAARPGERLAGDVQPLSKTH